MKKNATNVMKLGDVMCVLNGYAFDSGAFTQGQGFPLIRIRDLKTNAPSVNYSAPYEKLYVVQKDDLLVGMDGEFVCYKWNGPPALLNQRVCKLVPDTSRLDPDFLFYAIGKELKRIEDDTAFTTVKHLSSKQITEIEIPLPPLPEQRRVAGLLKAQLAAVEKARRAAEERVAAAGAMDRAIERELFAALADEDQAQLGDLIKLSSGSFLPAQSMRKGPYPVYGGNGINGWHDEFLFSRSVVTIGRVGAHCGVVHLTKPNSWVTDNALYATMKNAELDDRFLALCLHHLRLNSLANRMGQPVISGKVIYDQEIPVPSRTKQQEVVARHSALTSTTACVTTAAAVELSAIEALPGRLLGEVFG